MNNNHQRKDSKGKFDQINKEDKGFAEDKYLKSYNQELKESMTSFKMINQVPLENKLMHYFQGNNNTSISSTTGQLEEVYLETINSNEILRNQIEDLKAQIAELRVKIEEIPKLYDIYHPLIEKLRASLNEYLVQQKVENQRLLKEISVTLKENDETQKLIYYHLGKLHGLEREVGVKSRQLVYAFDSSIIDNEVNNKFVIQEEDI